MVTISASAAITEDARAKVNLALHVTGRREDGYHLLDSLVVFPKIGDRLSALPDKRHSLKLTGAFAAELCNETGTNLVTRAVDTIEKVVGKPLPPLALTLEKNLPLASGIGGGSADAAATLRLAMKVLKLNLPEWQLHDLALSLGADVPVCLVQQSVRMQGIGDRLSNLPPLPEFGLILVNPKITVSTPVIFNSLKNRKNPALPPIPNQFGSIGAFVKYLNATRNDLQAAAETLCPAISHVLQTIAGNPQCLLARMSGSGATCFGICESGLESAIAAQIKTGNPHWWVACSKVR